MRRYYIFGVFFLIILAGILFVRSRNSSQVVAPTPTPNISDIEKKFNLDIPEDADKIALSGQGNGVATRKYTNGTFLATILADLPDPEKGVFYQVWIAKGTEATADYEIVSLGKMLKEKGGYLLDYQDTSDKTSYNTYLVTKEKYFDNTPEEVVLKGQF